MKITHVTLDTYGFTLKSTHKTLSISYTFVPQMGTELDREPDEFRELEGWTIKDVSFQDQALRIYLQRDGDEQPLFLEKKGCQFEVRNA